MVQNVFFLIILRTPEYFSYYANYSCAAGVWDAREHTHGIIIENMKKCEFCSHIFPKPTPTAVSEVCSVACDGQPDELQRHHC